MTFIEWIFQKLIKFGTKGLGGFGWAIYLYILCVFGGLLSLVDIIPSVVSMTIIFGSITIFILVMILKFISNIYKQYKEDTRED